MSGEKFTDDEIQIRVAKKEDMRAVAELIQELADFEKMSDGPKLSVKDLERDGFESDPPAFLCKVAELREGNTGCAIVGYALFFPTYSTWEGRALLLEDLYVRPGVRRRGVGKRLFQAVAKEALSRGCSRLDFHVLEWNPAREFYACAGAVDLTTTEQWRLYRLAGDYLRNAAGQSGPGDQIAL